MISKYNNHSMMLVWLKHIANGLDKSWLKQTRAQKNVDKTGLAL